MASSPATNCTTSQLSTDPTVELEDPRDWTSAGGWEIVGEFIGRTGKHVRLKTFDGEIGVPLDSLCEQDRGGLVLSQLPSAVQVAIHWYGKAISTITGMDHCRFHDTQHGPCIKIAASDGVCSEHSVLKCACCSRQAVYICPHEWDGVACESPLCDDPNFRLEHYQGHVVNPEADVCHGPPQES
jgi:hypothetical protein